MPQDHILNAFLELHRGLPRQGPGSRETTLGLLRTALESRPAQAAPVRQVLDAGSGPGASALLLAEELPQAQVTALDLHQPFLDELDQEAEHRGLSARVSTLRQSMEDLSVLPEPVDLLWCESAVYSVGFQEALRAWRPHLAPDARVVLTEIEWTQEPAAEIAKYWNAQYPLKNYQRNRRLAQEAGFEVLHHAPLPESDWWDEYYTPLLERIQAIDRGDPAAVEAARGVRQEIAMRQDYGTDYAYSGYVLRLA